MRDGFSWVWNHISNSRIQLADTSVKDSKYRLLIKNNCPVLEHTYLDHSVDVFSLFYESGFMRILCTNFLLIAIFLDFLMLLIYTG